jgi:hypothetical protein
VRGLNRDVTKLIRQASRDLEEITGLRAVAVVGWSAHDQGWKMSVELLEREAVPDTMDVLAIYDVELAADGHVLRFERTGLRHRGDTGF